MTQWWCVYTNFLLGVFLFFHQLWEPLALEAYEGDKRKIAAWKVWSSYKHCPLLVRPQSSLKGKKSDSSFGFKCLILPTQFLSFSSVQILVIFQVFLHVFPIPFILFLKCQILSFLHLEYNYALPCDRSYVISICYFFCNVNSSSFPLSQLNCEFFEGPSFKCSFISYYTACDEEVSYFAEIPHFHTLVVCEQMYIVNIWWILDS